MTDTYFDFKNLNSNRLNDNYQEIKQAVTQAMDSVTNATGSRTFENTVRPIIHLFTDVEAKINCFEYASNLYPDKNIRDTMVSLKNF